MARNKNNDCWSHKHDFPIEEIWKTKEMLARDIVPRLKAFKALDKHVYPMGMDMRQWNNIIQKMTDTFELMKYSSCRTLTDEENQIITKGLGAFLN